MNILAPLIDDLVLCSFAGLMVWAAVSDIRTYKIPNRVSLGVVAIYPAHVLASATPVDWVGGVVVGLAALAVGFVFFVMKWTGAGDAKLLTAAALWAGKDLISPFILVTCLAGGALSLAMMLRARFARPAASEGGPSAAVPFLALLKVDVPYGVAIAVGGVYIALRRFAF